MSCHTFIEPVFLVLLLKETVLILNKVTFERHTQLTTEYSGKILLSVAVNYG